MDKRDTEMTNLMHLKEKTSKASGNIIADLSALFVSVSVFAASGILYLLHHEQRLIILQVFFLSLIATIICNCELLNSVKTLKRIKSCKDASESKLIIVERITYSHFHTVLAVMSLIAGIILLSKI